MQQANLGHNSGNDPAEAKLLAADEGALLKGVSIMRFWLQVSADGRKWLMTSNYDTDFIIARFEGLTEQQIDFILIALNSAITSGFAWPE